MDLREIQVELSRLSFYPADKIDGDYGTLSSNAINALALKRHEKLSTLWPVARKIIAGEQLVLEENGIEVGSIDGRIGTRTIYGREVWEGRKATNGRPNLAVENWRDKEPASTPSMKSTVWPSQAETSMIRFFGQPGSNQGKLILPKEYPNLRLAWDTDDTLRAFTMHERVILPATRVLQRVLDHYGPSGIISRRLDRWGGCLNVRRMRGGSAWSMHAWGAAIDWDPERNQLQWGRDRASLDDSSYDMWWSLWEAEGFVSLGRRKNFDWMHVQAATL